MAAEKAVNAVKQFLDKRGGVRPHLVQDNGSQFVAKEWR
ncbi:MAG: transposase family protein [Chloroflexi bacterium]|nr:transposase family protein [Chloroflexota bacterium]